MSQAKHTPGPWKVVSQAVTQEVEVFEIAEVSHLRIICDGPGDGFSKAGTPEADARLIAAAPDLLAALIDVVGDDETLQNPWRVAARAAIAKATGVGQ